MCLRGLAVTLFILGHVPQGISSSNDVLWVCVHPGPCASGNLQQRRFVGLVVISPGTFWVVTPGGIVVSVAAIWVAESATTVVGYRGSIAATRGWVVAIAVPSLESSVLRCSYRGACQGCNYVCKSSMHGDLLSCN